MRRAALAAVAVLAALLLGAVALLGGVVAISRGWQRDRLRGAAETALARELATEVAIGALEGPLVPDLVARELRIGPATSPTLEIRELRVAWDPRASAAERRLVIRSVAVRGVRLAAARDADGRMHAPGLLAEDPDAPPFALPVPLGIDRVSLADLELRLELRDSVGPGELAAAGRAELGPVRWPEEGGDPLQGSAVADLVASGSARRWLETAHLEVARDAAGFRIEADAALAPALGRLALRARGDALDAVEIERVRLAGGEAPPLELVRPTVVRREAERFAVEDLEIRSGDQSLTLSGAIGGGRFDGLRAVVRDLDASLASRLAGAPGLGGRLSGEVSLDGEIARPSGSARIAWREPHVDGWSGEQIDAEARWEPRSASLRASVARSGHKELLLELGLPLAADGGLPWWEQLRKGDPAALPSSLRLVVRAERLDLEALSRWLPERVRAVRGALTGELSIAGGPRPRAEGGLSVEGLGLDLVGLQRPIEGARARLEIAPDPAGIRIERFEGSAPGIDVEASGALGLAGPADLTLRARIADLEGFATAHGATSPAPGALEAQLLLDGEWRRPELRGSVSWREATPAALGPSRIEVELASKGAWLDGDLRIWQGERLAARGELRHPYPEWSELGAAPLAGPGAELALRAEDLELATLAPLVGRRVRDLHGRVDARVTVRGGAERPSLEGALVARDAGFRVPVLRQTFEPIEASLRFRDDLLTLERIRVGREGAHAQIDGTLQLDASLRPRSADLEIAFEHFPASRSAVLTTDLSGRAHLEGPLDAPKLHGSLALSDVRVRLADAEDPALREIRVIASDAARREAGELREGPRGPTAFDRAEIDLELSVPRNSWVRGQGANVELAGALELDKAPFDAPRLSGDVEALRGTYRFQGRRFDVRRGTVTFDGAAKPDPLLDIEARHRVRDVVVVVTLGGRLSDPKVRLSSEPELPEDDVLAYLLFGRPSSELTAAGGSQQQLQAAAGALATGIALGEASSALEELIPIDTFAVDMREDGRSADLSVGKYVTDDLFVTYERRLGSDPIDGVRVHLRLTDHWSVATDAATDSTAGADLIWSFDY